MSLSGCLRNRTVSGLVGNAIDAIGVPIDLYFPPWLLRRRYSKTVASHPAVATQAPSSSSHAAAFTTYLL